MNSPASPAASSAAVSFDDVTLRRGSTTLVDGIGFEVEAGGFFALIGRSGAGKTTTLRLMLGLQTPSRGTIRTLGRAPTRLHGLPGQVGAVLDKPGLQPQLTLAQNLKAHARLHGASTRRLREWLDRLDLRRVSKRRSSKLSQGETQRAMLARALLLGPKLLVLDEPLVHLDPASAATALEVLQEVHQAGCTVVISSHHLEYVERAATHLAFVHGGQVLLQGKLSDLLQDRRTWYRISATPFDKAQELLAGHPNVKDVSRSTRQGELRLRIEGVDASVINAALHEAGCAVHRIHPEEDSLDGLFREALAQAEGTA